MKEQRIVIEISRDGKITADAEGFSGNACLHDLERLLQDLSPGKSTVERKPEDCNARLAITRKQELGTRR